jgi:pantothenate kinase
MEATYQHVADDIISKIASLELGGQLLIGIAGPPGGGKSTCAARLQELVPHSIVVPMDGYHFTKVQLSQFPDPVAALTRRGAHWTFDAESFVADLESLRSLKSKYFPAFQHGVGDPVPNSIQVIDSEVHKVVLIEGNYLLLDVAPWDKIVTILDYTYFVDCELAVVEERLVQRHMKVNGNTEERARERVAINDSLNAQLILSYKHRANSIILSI